jgi:hypothetical protein
VKGLLACPGRDGLACPDDARTLNGRICRACVKGLGDPDPDPDGNARKQTFTDRNRNPRRRNDRQKAE